MCEKKALFTENPKATKAAKENRYSMNDTNVSQSNDFLVQITITMHIN